MREHHGLRARGERRLQTGNVDVGRFKVHIHENRHRSVLDDRSDRRRKTGGDGDHLVAAHDPAFAQQRRGERLEREEIRGRAGIDEKRRADAEVGGEFPLEAPGPRPVGTPEVERRIYEVLHLLLVEDASGVVDAALAGHERRIPLRRVD